MSASGDTQPGGQAPLEWIKTASELDAMKHPHDAVELQHSSDGRFTITHNAPNSGLKYRLHDKRIINHEDFGLIRQAEARAEELRNGVHPVSDSATGELKWESSASRWERLKTHEGEVEVEHTTDGRFAINRRHHQGQQSAYPEFIGHDKLTHRESESFRSLKEAKAWVEGVRTSHLP